MNSFRFLVFILFAAAIHGQHYEPLDYKSGFSTIQMLGRDIYRSLDPKHQALINAQPISLDTDRNPFVKLFVFTDAGETIRGVWGSQGFIDLVNHVAHAQAVDKKKKGYFAKYIATLDGAGDSIPPLPDRDNPEFWTDGMLNEQLSNFNSIVGIVVGINLAQHYLGLYERYKGKLSLAGSEPDGVALNNLLTASEWEESYRCGLNNAMSASCMTEGYLPFCEALSRMKHRPAWVSHFLPKQARFDSMRREMVKLQRRFLTN